MSLPILLLAALLAPADASAAASPPHALTDEGIARAIEADLAADGFVPAQRIDVAVTTGVATLAGRVSNLLAKERAAEIASSIRGVRSVVNRVEVAPPPAPDEEVRKRVLGALNLDPALDFRDYDVRVDDGIVVLGGATDSWRHKQLALRAVRGVAGVRGVVDRVTVDYARVRRPDADVELAVRRRLDWDIWVNARRIEVDAREGKVYLSGAVGSLAEKTRAYADAWVPGAVVVDDSALRVDPWLRDRTRRLAENPLRSDAAIKEAVEDALLLDPRVLSFRPDVDVSAGRVTLTGTVASLRARRAAEQDARNTVGVWSV